MAEASVLRVQDAVKLLRKVLALTQEELAAELGVTETTIGRYETTLPPKGKMLLKLEEFAREKGEHIIATFFCSAQVAEISDEMADLKSRMGAQTELMETASQKAARIIGSIGEKGEAILRASLDLRSELDRDASLFPPVLREKYVKRVDELLRIIKTPIPAKRSAGAQQEDSPDK